MVKTSTAAAIICAILLTPAAEASRSESLWEDATGDAQAPGGFDLTAGTISRDKKDLEFTVTLADMPPSGSLPEAFRFLWTFAVDGRVWRLTVKSADIGKPDVAQGQTTERVGRVDAQGHFRLEGECSATQVGVTFRNCVPIAYVDGAFDPSAGSFVVSVPMQLVRARPGSLIAPAPPELCQVCWLTHVAERSSNNENVVIDSASHTRSYQIPRR